MLYDLDVSAQATKILGYAAQQFNPYSPVTTQYELYLGEPKTELVYNTMPYRAEEVGTYMAGIKESGRTLSELRLFFPDTYRKIKTTESASQFPDFGTLYKKLITNDLENAFSNVVNYIDQYPNNALPDNESSFLKSQTIANIKATDNYFAFKMLVDVLEKANSGYNPINLISYLDNKYYTNSGIVQPAKTMKDKIGVAMHGFYLVASALRDTNSNTTYKASFWLTQEQLNNLTPTENRYFMALVYQKDPRFFNQFFNQGNPVAGSVFPTLITPYISSVLEQLTAIQDFINANPGQSGNEVYTRFLRLYSNILTNNPFLPQDLKLLFANSNDLFSLYENKYNHYTGTNIYYIFKILSDLNQNKQESVHEMHTVENHATFFSDIANCNNQEQLNMTLDKYLPVLGKKKRK